MARMIDDEIHWQTDHWLKQKYTTHADARQAGMGLSYITAERQDLVREIAAFVRLQIQRSRGS